MPPLFPTPIWRFGWVCEDAPSPPTLITLFRQAGQVFLFDDTSVFCNETTTAIPRESSLSTASWPLFVRSEHLKSDVSLSPADKDILIAPKSTDSLYGVF